ncbi:MAG: hypothetical protein WAN36_16395 [Calditrichia bacterium]
MKRHRFIIITLLSMTLIGLELAWTRIFSAEFFYTFAFLVLSLAILGLGLGALALRLVPRLNQEKWAGIMLSLTALFALAGPPTAFLLQPDFSALFSSWMMVGKLMLIIVLLSAAYFTGGVALAYMFRQNNKEMPRLYMADLMGAGLAVLLSILMMNWLGTPKTTFLIALPVLTAAFLVSPGWRKSVPAALAVLLFFLLGKAEPLLEAERQEPANVVHRHWDAVAKVKLYEAAETYQTLNIDNVARTSTIKFNNPLPTPDSAKLEFGLNVSGLIHQFDSCRYLVIGAGGGGDILQAAQESNVTEIHAVEVIPHINEMLVNGELAEFSGYLYQDPRVKAVTEDGRAYVRRFKNKFDMIYSSSSNTFAALASGAFALAENYLFTTEAFCDYWEALTDSGYMVIEHQVYVPRLVSEVMEALEHCDINNPDEHFAVFDWPRARRNILLLSRRPLTPEILNHAVTGSRPLEGSGFCLLHPAADSLQNNLVDRIVQHGWLAASDSAKTDISPCSDDRPFIAQMGLWRNLKVNSLEKVIPYSDLFGFPLSKMIIVIILAVVTVLIIPLNLLPYLTRGEKLKMVPWLYFFTIGMAFMIVEVILIQKYALFIGPSVYSIVTILLTLLLASGIGSRFSDKLPNKFAFGGIVIWLLLDIFLFGHITESLSGLPILTRVLTAGILIFPLGFFMGMPFPKGALKVGELIDWGFAVNGAASVLGSTAIMLVAFSYGFGPALLIGAVLYSSAFGLLSWREAW